jgi:enoyl-[acyl-carrier protein] reductase I
MAEPLMQDGGALFTLSYYGAEKVVEHYNLMGPVKAALESAVRYLAYEFGPKGIRVHAISPGPVKTRAASGIDHFDELLEQAASRSGEKSSQHRGCRHGDTALATDYAKLITGETVYVDGGYHIVG